MRYPCKKELMSQRKKKHMEIVPICRNYVKGTCHFDNCWYKHEQSENEWTRQDLEPGSSPTKRIK